MKIEFGRIELRNFMSFVEEAFDFSSCKGMSLIQGKNNDIPGAKNGCGKSQLALSLLYALFGQLQNKIKNENLVNKYTDSKDMDVALALVVDGEKYKIRRGLAKGKNSYLELFKVNDNSEVDITKSTILETQEFIEKELIHCDVSIFLRTILLTADQTYNFYMLKKADKKDFIEKLFDISVFEDMYRAIHKDSLALEKEAIASQNRMLVFNKSLDDYNERSAKYEETKQNRLKVLEAEVKKYAEELKAVKAAEIKANPETVAALNANIDKLRNEYDAHRDKLFEMHGKLTDIAAGLHKIDESIMSREKIVGKHSAVLDKLCDKCKAVFMEHYSLGPIIAEVADFKKKRLVLEKTKSGIIAKSAGTAAKCEKVKHDISAANAKLADLTAASNRVRQAVSNAESLLSEAINGYKAVKSQVNPYIELIGKGKSDLEAEADRIAKIESKAKYLKFAEGIVSQDTLRKFIIKDLVVLLNNKIKTYLTKLGAKYYVEFDEDMDYTFIAQSGTYEWSNFSAGERMRIMVATSFAFRDFMSIRNGLNANVLFLDEYFDSAIDSLCVESIIGILKGYSAVQDQNVFVISHRSEVNPEMFNRTILVEKTDNIAHVKIDCI